jgi:glutathione S-transferase
MGIDFYAGSGSPYAWRAWLALEHKELSYQLRMMSFDSGDLKKPDFLAINPRGRVPAAVDNGFAVYESAAILEYLEDAYPKSGKALFPRDLKRRAEARRLVREADEYLAHAMERLVGLVFFTPQANWDAAAIEQARDKFVSELPHFERALTGDFFCEGPGAVDFTIYPILALVLRIEMKYGALGARAAISPKLGDWMRRVEALPYFAKTYPPHWKKA